MASPTAIPHPETSAHHHHQDPVPSSSATAPSSSSSSSNQLFSSGFSPRSFNAPSAGLVSPLYRYARSASTSGGVAGHPKEYFDLSRSPTTSTATATAGGGAAPTRPGPGPTSSSRDQQQQQQQQEYGARSRSKSNSVSSTLSSSGSTADEPVTPGGTMSSQQQQQQSKSLSSVSFTGGFALGRVPSYPLAGTAAGSGSAGGYEKAQKRMSSGSMFNQASIDAMGGNGPGGGAGAAGGGGGGTGSAARHASTRSFSATSASSSSTSPPIGTSTGMSNFDPSSTGSSAGRGVTNLLRKLSIGTPGQNLKSPSTTPITPPTFSGAAVGTTGGQQHASGIAAPAPTPAGSMSSTAAVPPASAPAHCGEFRNLNSGNEAGRTNAGAMNDSVLTHQQQARMMGTNGASGRGGAISANDLAAVSAPLPPPPQGAKVRRGRQTSMSGEGTKRRPSPMGERLLMGHFAH